MRKILCISCGLIFSLLIISAKCNSSTSPEGTRLTLDFEGTSNSGYTEYTQAGYTFSITNSGKYLSGYNSSTSHAVNGAAVGRITLTSGGSYFDVHSLYLYNCNCQTVFRGYRNGASSQSHTLTPPDGVWTNVSLNFTNIDRLDIDITACGCGITTRCDDMDISVY